MKKNIRDVLDDWPKSFIRDTDLAHLLPGSDDARYSTVKRALKAGLLVHLRRGLYLIASKSKQQLPDVFELAAFIYQPSFISLESALSHHNVIPEAVYAVTSVTPKRAREFCTPVATFTYKHVPEKIFI